MTFNGPDYTRDLHQDTTIYSLGGHHFMKKKHGDKMKDPFYAGLIFGIETLIFNADAAADSLGCALTDSQIQSALIRAKKLCQGGTPLLSATSEREQILENMVLALFHAPDEIPGRRNPDGQQPLEISDWLIAIDATLASLKIHKSGAPGGRDYLDFLRQFIPKAGGK